MDRGLGNLCCSRYHQEHLRTAPCHFRETKAKSREHKQIERKKKNGIIKEDKSMDNLFELFKNLYLEIQVAQTNYPWTCLLLLYRFSSSSRFACALGFWLWFLWNDKELYEDVLDDIESNKDYPNPYPIPKLHIGFNAKYLFIILRNG